MAVDLDDSRDLRLRREVLYPQRQNTGVGVMLVASAAMFFAVASSAFILRAQMPPQSCVHRSATVVEPVEAISVDLIDGEALSQGSGTCGEPIYQENSDGTDTVVFNLCPPEPSVVE